MSADRFAFARLKAAVQPFVGASAPAIGGSADMSAALGSLGPRPAYLMSSGKDLNRAARMGLGIVADIEAASRHLQPSTEYKAWRDEWMYPIASAIVCAPPEDEQALRAIYRDVNQRTADPGKLQQLGEGYLNDADKLLDAAVASRLKGDRLGEEIGYGRIYANALANGWDGRRLVAPANGNLSVPTTVVAPFFAPVAFAQQDLTPLQWIIVGVLLRGAISVLAALGGGAKTAFAVALAVLMACGRRYAGPMQINAPSAGFKVGFISGEEGRNQFALLTAATCAAFHLTPAECARVAQNLVFHDATVSGMRIGEPRANQREDMAPEEHDPALQAFAGGIAASKLDVVFCDTFAALCAVPSENDNAAVTRMMNRLGRAARRANCALLLLHHAPKTTRETAAANQGEATLSRGAGAIINSARVALGITPLAPAEAAQAALMGVPPDSVRRLGHIKVNDVAPMDGALFRVMSVQVPVADGSHQAVRAIEFLSPLPASAAGGIPDAVRNVAMKAIDAGVRDAQGTRVPLSPGGGKANARDAVTAVSRALMHANQSLAETHARTAAKGVLKDLIERIGCVVVEDAPIPQYKTDGRANGSKPGRALRTAWNLAPWMSAAPGPDQAPGTGLDADPASSAPADK